MAPQRRESALNGQAERGLILLQLSYVSLSEILSTLAFSRGKTPVTSGCEPECQTAVCRMPSGNGGA
jgi:hypothetical protein